LLPKGDIKIAKSFDECKKILAELRAAKRAKARKNPTATLSEKRVSELPWATDLPKALEQAKTENKTVLLDFTGSDWCVWCIKFDDDILSHPEFASYAKTNLVMVLLDFPNAKKQSEALKKTNQNLQEKFKVDGFPTYVALNSDGKEIGRQVGYLSGGPQAFIEELEKFRKQ
jgi:protein disulfide-isomerase